MHIQVKNVAINLCYKRVAEKLCAEDSRFLRYSNLYETFLNVPWGIDRQMQGRAILKLF